jgi:tripartite-type tricarboxylate transporter receptor subunit TctC
MLIDLIGGQIQIGFDNLPSSMAPIKSGKVRAVAVTTAKRWPGTPDVPTVAESGVPGYEVSGWFGLLAPAGTPKPVIDALYKAVSAMLKQPDVQKQMLDLGAEPGGNAPDAFAQAGRGRGREVEKGGRGHRRQGGVADSNFARPRRIPACRGSHRRTSICASSSR